MEKERKLYRGLRRPGRKKKKEKQKKKRKTKKRGRKRRVVMPPLLPAAARVGTGTLRGFSSRFECRWVDI